MIALKALNNPENFIVKCLVYHCRVLLMFTSEKNGVPFKPLCGVGISGCGIGLPLSTQRGEWDAGHPCVSPSTTSCPSDKDTSSTHHPAYHKRPQLRCSCRHATIPPPGRRLRVRSSQLTRPFFGQTKKETVLLKQTTAAAGSSCFRKTYGFRATMLKQLQPQPRISSQSLWLMTTSSHRTPT